MIIKVNIERRKEKEERERQDVMEGWPCTRESRIWVQPRARFLPAFPLLGFYCWDVTARHGNVFDSCLAVIFLHHSSFFPVDLASSVNPWLKARRASDSLSDHMLVPQVNIHFPFLCYVLLFFLLLHYYFLLMCILFSFTFLFFFLLKFSRY